MHTVAQAIAGSALLLAGVALTIYGAVFGSYAPAFRWGVAGWILALAGVLVLLRVLGSTRRGTITTRAATAPTGNP